VDIIFPTNFLAQVTEIIPYPRNAREHSESQISQIVASIREFGFTNPILVDASNVLIAGHGRLAAAQQLGMRQVPAIRLTGLSDAQIAALRIADNKLALNATWDDDLLRIELSDLRDVGFELGLTGFNGDELDALFADRTVGLTDPDDVPEPPAEPITQPGDVWLLGRHRLVCGDCTKAEDVALALNGVAPHLMVTDPPYGVDYDPEWRNETGIAEDGSLQRVTTGRVRKVIGAKAVGEVVNDHRADWREAWALFPGDVAYCWHSGIHASEVAESLVASRFAIRAQIIWDKMRLIIGRGDYHWQHEPCWYAVRKSATGHWAGDRKQTTIWQISHRASETGHSTQKPVECMRRPIENNSSPGQAVYDPFVGSGTTIIAAEMTGRACHAIEISPAYCDVAMLRWQAFTGQIATRLVEHAAVR
jgi:DNA modification methylase